MSDNDTPTLGIDTLLECIIESLRDNDHGDAEHYARRLAMLAEHKEQQLAEARRDTEKLDNNLKEMLTSWKERVRKTPERTKGSGSIDYTGGLIDAYGSCIRELEAAMKEGA